MKCLRNNQSRKRWRKRGEQCSPSWRPDMRAGGEGAFLTNTGVLVTHVQTPSRSAVGLQGCVRMRQARKMRLAWGLWWHRAVKPRRLALQQTGDGVCRRAVRLIGARAGPCTGPEAIAGCVALRKAMALQQTVDGGCRRAVRPIGTRAGPCTGPKLSPAASPCTRPPMASSLKKAKVGQGR